MSRRSVWVPATTREDSSHRNDCEANTYSCQTPRRIRRSLLSSHRHTRQAGQNCGIRGLSSLPLFSTGIGLLVKPPARSALNRIVQKRALRENFVDQTELFGRFRGHKRVALQGIRNDLYGLSRMFSVHLVEPFADRQNLLGMALDVARLTLEAA